MTECSELITIPAGIGNFINSAEQIFTDSLILSFPEILGVPENVQSTFNSFILGPGTWNVVYSLTFGSTTQISGEISSQLLVNNSVWNSAMLICTANSNIEGYDITQGNIIKSESNMLVQLKVLSDEMIPVTIEFASILFLRISR